ncbi:MAG: hypothetical protein HeimC2_45190 [Candidatus Heimdallarchaeota archaeon LC_2]|nr:MAG: hypothetical protein HeimC2_45190 [Candidatus Heimdallarchaeota archaeon LC_2]
MLSKIETKKYHIFSKCISAKDLDKLKELLITFNIGFKVRIRLKELIHPLSKSLCLIWGIELSKMSSNHVMVAGIFFEKINLWSLDVVTTVNLIYTLSTSDEWRIREVAINLLFKGITKEYSNYKNCFTQLTKSEDPKQRRVAIRAAKHIANLSIKDKAIKPWIFLEIEKYFSEENDFVLRATIDTFSSGFLRHCPDLIIDSIINLIQNELKNKTKINILRAINGNVEKEYVEKILNIIDYFILESNETIKYAQLAVLKTMSRVDVKKISIWLEERMAIENVVEFWAQLAVEGFIVDDYLY